MTMPGDFDVPFRINAQDLRADHDFDRAQPGVTRILLVGDSFVFGVGLELADTLGAGLQRALTADPAWNRPTEVVSTGCPGYGLDAYAVLIERWVPKLDPDLVVITLFAGNDLLDYELEASDPRVVIEGGLTSQRQTWTYHLRRFSTLAYLLLNRFKPYESFIDHRPEHPTPAQLDHILATIRPLIARIAAAPGTDGPLQAVAVVHGFRAVQAWNEGRLGFAVRPLREVLADFEGHGIPVVDTHAGWLDLPHPPGSYISISATRTTTPRAATWSPLGSGSNCPPPRPAASRPPIRRDAEVRCATAGTLQGAARRLNARRADHAWPTTAAARSAVAPGFGATASALREARVLASKRRTRVRQRLDLPPPGIPHCLAPGRSHTMGSDAYLELVKKALTGSLSEDTECRSWKPPDKALRAMLRHFVPPNVMLLERVRPEMTDEGRYW